MNEEIRRAVRVELTKRDMTQKDLAERIGSRHQYISTVLRGKAADMPDIWQRILAELDIELEPIVRD